jgi:hypothetical protein
VHRCDAIEELAETSRIHLHLIPSGRTDIMQPLGSSVFGDIKAECRDIHRGDMAHREGKHMAKADLTACLVLAWDRAGDSPQLEMLPPGHTGAGARVADGGGPLTQ